MRFPPKVLNPGQRLLIQPGFVYFTITFVALLTVVDLVQMVTDLYHGVPCERPSHVAVRLITLGVFLELRGHVVGHLLGREKVEADRKGRHMSEVCEAFGAHLTVGGLFLELVHDTQTLVPGAVWVFYLGSSLTILLTAAMLHVVSDLVRGLLGPIEDDEAASEA